MKLVHILAAKAALLLCAGLGRSEDVREPEIALPVAVGGVQEWRDKDAPVVTVVVDSSGKILLNTLQPIWGRSPRADAMRRTLGLAPRLAPVSLGGLSLALKVALEAYRESQAAKGRTATKKEAEWQFEGSRIQILIRADRGGVPFFL